MPPGACFIGSTCLSRNLVITVTGAIFLTAALPVFDMTVLSSNGVTPPVFHPLALALIAITAALAWRRVAASKGWCTRDRRALPAK